MINCTLLTVSGHSPLNIPQMLLLKTLKELQQLAVHINLGPG